MSYTGTALTTVGAHMSNVLMAGYEV